MEKIKILLTGGSGMVGSNLLNNVGIKNFQIYAPTSKDLNLTDYESVCNYIEKINPNIIIHAAGKVGGIQANIKEPVAYFIDNLDMGRNIVLAARKFKIKKIINIGSCCLYPRNQIHPISESLILKGELEPTNEGFALAKIATARLCDYIRREDPSCQYKTIIPCGLYGDFDKFDPSDSHLIPAIIHKVHQAKVKKISRVEIWGDGQARRELMYAADLAEALLKAIHDFDILPDYMNIGLGFDHTINEYYEAVAKVVGFDGEFIHDTSKPVGVGRKLLNIDRQLNWGWSAMHTLSSGIEKTYKYYLQKYA